MFEGLTVTGILGLFVVVALVLYRSQRNENAASEARQSQLDSLMATNVEQGRQIAQLYRDNFRCEYRMSLAIGAMRQAGIDVPREIYDDYSDSAPTQ